MIFGHNYLISEPIFELYVALFRTLGLQKDDMVIFFLWCFRKVRFRKMQFLKDGVQTVGVMNRINRYLFFVLLELMLKLPVNSYIPDFL